MTIITTSLQLAETMGSLVFDFGCTGQAPKRTSVPGVGTLKYPGYPGTEVPSLLFIVSYES
eukprot:984712-Rhodomonas_salina.1